MPTRLADGVESPALSTYFSIVNLTPCAAIATENTATQPNANSYSEAIVFNIYFYLGN